MGLKPTAWCKIRGNFSALRRSRCVWAFLPAIRKPQRETNLGVVRWKFGVDAWKSSVGPWNKVVIDRSPMPDIPNAQMTLPVGPVVVEDLPRKAPTLTAELLHAR